MKKIFYLYAFLFAFTKTALPQWFPLPTGATNYYLTDTQFISSDTGWVVGKGPAILKTTDGGNTWVNQTTSTNEDICSIFFIDAMTGWAGGYEGSIFKTTNGGTNWIQKNSGYIHTISQVKFIDSLNGSAVVGKWVGSTRYGAIVHTTNGGENWVSKVFIDNYAFIDLDFFDPENGWAVGTNGLLFRTTNGGNSWMGPQFISDHWLHDVHFPDKFIGYAVGGTSYNDIILKTTNSGDSWSVMRQSFSNRLLAGTFFVDTETGWAVGLDGTILNTTNGGVAWIRQETNVTSLFHDVFMIDSTGYAVGEVGKVYKYDPNYQYPLTVTRPNGSEIFFSNSQEYINWLWSDTSSHVTIEYSYGTGWNTIVTNHPNTGEFLWAVPNVNTNQALVKISKADDSGVYDISNYPFSILPFIPVELVSFNADVLSGKVALSWSTATEANNLGFEIQRSIDNKDFFVIGFVNGYGTTTGVNHYTYTDQNVSSGKYSYRLKQINFNGTFAYSDIIDAEIVGPEEFTLNQNYPNPFNPSTVIRFNIPISDYVTIKIYDMLGNEVREIISEELAAGRHSTEFVTDGLSSGTYFYRLQASSFSDTKKMIILK